MNSSPPSSSTTEPPPAESRQEASAPRRTGLALVLLGAAAALTAYAVQMFRQVQIVDPPVSVSLLTAPAEIAARQHDVIGTFNTGSAAGDRSIIIHPNGNIEFVEIGADPAAGRISDTYRIGRREKEFCLLTARSGIIDIVDIDTLVYCRDTYHRPR